MATQIIMDRTGDTRHYFDAKDPQALLKAEERFKELTLGSSRDSSAADLIYGPATYGNWE